MRAIAIPSFGGPEVLQLVERPAPQPARGEVLVRVRACGVNRADLLQRMGRYPAPPDAPADVPGLEFAGEVEAVGSAVTDVRIGQRVFGLVAGGAYAERVVVHGRALAHIPDGIDFAEAAAIPEAFITAYDAMVDQAHLAAGEVLLVSAVGSGVGTAAVQIARAIGARSIGTARTGDKLARAKALGMDDGIVPENGHFAAQVRALTAGRGVDVVLELVGGPYLNEDLACLAPRGRVMLVGLLAGASADFDCAPIYAGRRFATDPWKRRSPPRSRSRATCFRSWLGASSGRWWTACLPSPTRPPRTRTWRATQASARSSSTAPDRWRGAYHLPVCVIFSGLRTQ